MLLTLNFDIFKDKTQLLLNIMKSKQIKASEKNIILKTNSDGVEFYAFAPTIVARTFLSNDVIEMSNIVENELLSIPVSHLDTLLTAFISDISTPIDITISKISDMEIMFKVTEELDIDGEVTTNENVNSVQTLPVKANILKRLEIFNEVDSENENFSGMRPLSSNEWALASALTTDILPYILDKNVKTAGASFKEDFVTVCDRSYMLRYENTIKEILPEAHLGYHGVSTLRDVLNSVADDVPEEGNAPIDTYFSSDLNVLFVKILNSDTELALQGSRNLVVVADMFKYFSGNNTLSVTRKLLMTFIARMKALNTKSGVVKVRFVVDEAISHITVSTDDFESVLPIIDCNSTETDFFKDGLKNFTFEITLNQLENSLFGGKEGYDDDYSIGIECLNNSYLAKIYDGSDKWALTFQLR